VIAVAAEDVADSGIAEAVEEVSEVVVEVREEGSATAVGSEVEIEVAVGSAAPRVVDSEIAAADEDSEVGAEEVEAEEARAGAEADLEGAEKRSSNPIGMKEYSWRREKKTRW